MTSATLPVQTRVNPSEFRTKVSFDLFMLIFGAAVSFVGVAAALQEFNSRASLYVSSQFQLQLAVWPDCAFALFELWGLCTGIGSLWRLMDRRPALAADATGLRFHPSMHFGPVPWRKVRGITMESGGMSGISGVIKIQLDHRFWSMWAWGTGRSIQFNTTMIGLRPEEASA